MDFNSVVIASKAKQSFLPVGVTKPKDEDDKERLLRFARNDRRVDAGFKLMLGHQLNLRHAELVHVVAAVAQVLHAAAVAQAVQDA